MTKVFISYSRKDEIFAKKLNSALKDIELDSWFDRIDIPPVADFMEQIYRGIESADGFLFLISPDSVKSDVCRKEIDHAVKNGKRLIPLVVRDADANDVHSALAKLNWIFFREQDDFSESLKNLETGIKTDLVWVEAQRRLQVRALDWKNGKDRSLLLRGKDLREAEERLATAGQKDPQPTDLQRQFALESRRGESRTRNMVLAIGVAVIVALSFLSVFALNQERISRAGELAAQSESLRDTNMPLSFLLGVEAYTVRNNFRTQAALLGNISTPRLKSFLYGHSSRVKAVTFGENQNQLASASCKTYDLSLKTCTKGEIFLWDLSDETPTFKSFEGHDGWIYALAYNPDLQKNILASGGSDAQIILWNSTTGEQIDQPLKYHQGAISSLAFDSDGDFLASGDLFGHLFIWDVRNNQAVFEFQDEDFTGPIAGLGFSPDGNFLAFSLCRNYQMAAAIKCEQNKIAILDVDKKTIVGYLVDGHTDLIRCLAFSPNGTLLASGGNDQKIYFWEPGSLKQKSKPLVGHLDWIMSLSFIDDQRLASSSADKTITIWDLNNDVQPEVLKGHSDWVNYVAVDTERRFIAAASEDGSISLWNLAELDSSGTSVSAHSGLVSSIAIDSEKKMISGGYDGTLTIWDLTIRDSGIPKRINEVPIEIDNTRIPVGSVAISSTGTVATGHANGILLWDSELLQPKRSLIGPGDSAVASLSFSHDGNYLASGWLLLDGSTILIIWDVLSGEKVFESNIRHVPSVNFVFHPIDDQILAFADENYNLVLWKLSSQSQMYPPLAGHLDAISSIAFSPDGKIIAAASYQQIILWNVRTGKQIGLPLKSTELGLGTIESMAFSSDGSVLATNGCGEEGECTEPQVFLWDLKSHQLIGNVQSGKTLPYWIFPFALSFDKGGEAVVSGGCKQYDINGNCIKGQLVFWEAAPQAWIENSCQRAGRNLTADEWNQYFPGERYRATCSQWEFGNAVQQGDSTLPTLIEKTSNLLLQVQGVMKRNLPFLSVLVFSFCCFGSFVIISLGAYYVYNRNRKKNSR